MPAATASAADAFAAASARAHAAGATENPGVALALPPFRDHLSFMGRRQVVAGALGSPLERATALATEAAAPDLFLAAGCEEKAPRAWDRFAERFVPWLAGLLERRGAKAAEAREVAEESSGDLVQPPRSGGAKTTLGTWDGRARLSSWLATITIRRWVARRSRKSPSLDDVPEPPAGRAAGEDPLEAVGDPAAAARLVAALDAGWGRLTPKEALALLYRHRFGLSGSRIAVLMGVGDPRASRLLSAGLEKLRSLLSPVLDAEEAARPGLVAALSQWLTIRAGGLAPRDEAAAAPEIPRAS